MTGLRTPQKTSNAPVASPSDLRGAYSIDEFSAEFSIGRTRVYELIKKKELRAVKCGKRTLILRADAETWARSLPAVA